ncbi:hypothetical protein [Paraburkholderia bonniea]|uniref:hypothetical protein n=1 Tax=Paraburkholderia bonniea TaxID=2152891 RepID=UPI001291610B|nr:hypothetical protein [Paraburkholderia bonniea]
MESICSNAILLFENIEFDVTDRHSVPRLKAPSIEAVLSDEKRSAINLPNKRRANELTELMTRLVEPKTSGDCQQIRIFSPRDVYLPGMPACNLEMLMPNLKQQTLAD